MMFVLKALTRPPKFKVWGIDSTFQLEECQEYIAEDYVRWEMMLWVFFKKYHSPNRVFSPHKGDYLCYTGQEMTVFMPPAISFYL